MNNRENLSLKFSTQNGIVKLQACPNNIIKIIKINCFENITAYIYIWIADITHPHYYILLKVKIYV